MKRKLIIFQLLAFIALASACSDYFDVRPKSQVLAEALFETEQGYDDQLIGVYKRLSETSLYGTEMTFGLMEVLAQSYTLPTGSPYEEAANYNYDNTGIKAKIDGIWSEMYAAIANLNVMLEYIDEHESVFSDDNYALYKGEALGLRGFLHFELLRIFAPAYTVNSSAPAIPYVREYTTEVTSQSNVAEVTELAIADLKEALVLLESDPLYTADLEDAYTYRGNRSYRFNYYAAAATLARIYQWRGSDADMAEALHYATMVIEDSKFNWVHYSIMQSSNPWEWDKLFSSEVIFRLAITEMADLVEPYFYNNSVSTSSRLSPSQAQWDDIYEFSRGYGQDWRYEKNWQYDGSEPIFAKYWQYENSAYGGFIPVIRWSEMHYIAAEASMKTDPQQAIHYIDTVRANRYLSDFPLDQDLSQEEIREELYKEYRKELIGEGQLFYYYKRLNYPNIPGSAVAGNENLYVLPMPDNEIEFGNRE